MLHRHIALLLALLFATAAIGGLVVEDGVGPSTIHNDDSCDIGVYPAATLLLPHFEVDVTGRTDTTLFTVTNVSPLPQIAHVTLWTDWAFPVLTFNIFLTGYDTQSIDLWDVLVRGVIAPPRGTSSTNPLISPNPSGGSSPPERNTANPNLDITAVVERGTCSQLPGDIPQELAQTIVRALTTGIYQDNVPGGIGCGTARVGGVHAQARGYLTIDVVANCTFRTPDDPNYYRTDLLYDNVLLGEYQQLDGDLVAGNFAQGNSMVHIRAIPEGGRAGSAPGTKLPYTFYDRYTPAGIRNVDRRQPLPAQFAARWIEGGAGAFNTEYTIWREGTTAGTQECSEAIRNAAMDRSHLVRFDERENAMSFGDSLICTVCPAPPAPIPPSARLSTHSGEFPDNVTIDIAGWMFLDLNNGGTQNYTAASNAFAPANSETLVRASQNWLAVTMSAAGRYSTSTDAAMMGNGCTPARGTKARIAPAENPNP
jgi:hypothetical protein